MKTKKKIILISIFTLIIFFAFVGVMVKMISENGKCIDDPFSYSAKRLKESGGDYICGCQSIAPNLLDFTFSEEGIKIIEPEENYFNAYNFDLDIE